MCFVDMVGSSIFTQTYLQDGRCTVPWDKPYLNECVITILRTAFINTNLHSMLNNHPDVFVLTLALRPEEIEIPMVIAGLVATAVCPSAHSSSVHLFKVQRSCYRFMQLFWSGDSVSTSRHHFRLMHLSTSTRNTCSFSRLQGRRTPMGIITSCTICICWSHKFVTVRHDQKLYLTFTPFRLQVLPAPAAGMNALAHVDFAGLGA